MCTGCILTILCFLFGFLQLGSAQNAACTATQDAEQTTYVISNVPDVTLDSDCEYSWANNLVLANNVRQNTTVVRRWNISSLVTSWCFDKMKYTRRCVPETGLQKTETEHHVECTIVCRGSALLQEELDHYLWILAVIIALILVVLMAVFGVCYRDEIRKIPCSCNRGTYTVGVQQADVEMAK